MLVGAHETSQRAHALRRHWLRLLCLMSPSTPFQLYIVAEETGVTGCCICDIYGTILHGVLVYSVIYTRYRFRLPCTFILQNMIVYCTCLTTISVNT